MPAPSIAERRATAIAEHHPEKLYKRNRRLLKMTQSELHDFAASAEEDLPYKVKRAKGWGKGPLEA